MGDTKQGFSVFPKGDVKEESSQPAVRADLAAFLKLGMQIGARGRARNRPNKGITAILALMERLAATKVAAKMRQFAAFPKQAVQLVVRELEN